MEWEIIFLMLIIIINDTFLHILSIVLYIYKVINYRLFKTKIANIGIKIK